MEMLESKELTPELSFIFLKYPYAVQYMDELIRLYDKGLPAKVIEKLVKYNLDYYGEESKKKVLRDVNDLVDNKVHPQIISNFVTHTILFDKDYIILVWNEYREMRKNNQTDIEEDDIVRAITILNSYTSRLEVLRNALQVVRESEKFKKLFITEDSYEFEELLKIFRLGITDEQYEYIKNGGTNLSRLKMIRDCISNGITDERFFICANPKFKVKQMKQIYLGFKNGLSVEDILIYANPKYNHQAMELARIYLQDKKATKEEIIEFLRRMSTRRKRR